MMAQQPDSDREMNFQQSSPPQRQGQMVPRASAPGGSNVGSSHTTMPRPSVYFATAGPRPPPVYIDERGDLRRICEPRPLSQLGQDGSFFHTAPPQNEAEAAIRLHGQGQEKDGLGAGHSMHKSPETSSVWLPYLRELAKCPPVSFGELSNAVRTEYPFEKDRHSEEWWPQDFDNLFDLEAASARPTQDTENSGKAAGKDSDEHMLEQAPH